jgi:hypothetical protein
MNKTKKTEVASLKKEIKTLKGQVEGKEKELRVL